MKNRFLIVLRCAAIVIASASVMGSTAAAEPLSVVTTERVTSSAQDQATNWGLTASEWSRYKDVMANRRGVWSPGLDPITALGVDADTTAQRNHFAALYVRSEFERTRKELAFQLAVDRAWRRLYPDTPTLQARALPQVKQKAITRYALIVSADCSTCETTLAQRLTAMLAEATEGVDIHVVGFAENDRALHEWLAEQPQLHKALKAGKITVNHGSDFADLSAFPAIYAKHESGQWSREL